MTITEEASSYIATIYLSIQINVASPAAVSPQVSIAMDPHCAVQLKMTLGSGS